MVCRSSQGDARSMDERFMDEHGAGHMKAGSSERTGSLPMRSGSGHRSAGPALVWAVGLAAMTLVLLAGCGASTDAAGSTPAAGASPDTRVEPQLEEPAPPEPVSDEEDGDDPDNDEASSVAQTGRFEIGAPFEDTCTIAWPTAPSRGSQGTQIRTTCRGVDAGEYQFVDILVLDPDLEVTPSNSIVHVSGEVVDVVESEMGFTTLAVVAMDAEMD